jgi:hypothetical protein
MPSPNISCAELAEVYSVTDSNLRALAVNRGMDWREFANPDVLFTATLEGNSSALRRRLTDPSRRDNTRELIRLAIECRKTALEALRKAQI